VVEYEDADRERRHRLQGTISSEAPSAPDGAIIVRLTQAAFANKTMAPAIAASRIVAFTYELVAT